MTMTQACAISFVMGAMISATCCVIAVKVDDMREERRARNDRARTE